jgi:hypothetical protein
VKYYVNESKMKNMKCPGICGNAQGLEQEHHLKVGIIIRRWKRKIIQRGGVRGCMKSTNAAHSVW